MKKVLLIAGAALTIGSAGPAAAAPGAPFGCDAPAGQNCFFKIFYSPLRTRIVKLPTGMKVSIPDVQVGRDHYCIDVQKLPVYKCTEKLINANYNN